MITSLPLLLIALVYLLVLFAIAYLAEKRNAFTDKLAASPYIYALSIGVYCTAWTFYGSIGKASLNGFQFLAVYIGPTLFAPLWLIVLRKIIRIAKVQHLTTISDFISARYGKDMYLGAMVAVFCLIGVIPYIALQLKAISESFDLVSHGVSDTPRPFTILSDKALYSAILLAVFTILFGMRKVEATEQHRGMVAAIAFESLIKLIAFLVAGIFITYIVFNGFGDIFQQATLFPDSETLFTVSGKSPYGEWFSICFLSGIAAVMLPRQFQVGVVENVEERHLEKSVWIFPLYVFLINLFVLPVAFAGRILFAKGGMNADYYILGIPMLAGQKFITMLVYIGGFSAASSMIIVETISLSTMVSNNLILPFFIRNNFLQRWQLRYINAITLYSRRISVVLILLAAYLYFLNIKQNLPLVNIGLISFVSVAQFIPAIIGGIFWKQANKNAAITGILLGFALWFYTLVLPSVAGSGWVSASFVANGPFHIAWLKPYELFTLQEFSPVTNALFWSMFFNVGAFVMLSVWSKQSDEEKSQAEIFVDIFKYAERFENSTVWKGVAYLGDLQKLIGSFTGAPRAEQLLRGFANRYKIDWQTSSNIDSRLVGYTERILSGYVGSASARLMIAATTKEEQINLEGLMEVMRESQQLIHLNKELTRKTGELKQAKEQLEEANNNLKRLDALKDDFLTTVTHELRTPITSIRAFSEILYDNGDMESEQRQHYLAIITKETERIGRLISQVLDLEKYESGKQTLQLASWNLEEFIKECVESVEQLAKHQQITLSYKVDYEIGDLVFDRDKLTQVVINLLSNAIKHVEPGKGVIDLRAVQEQNRVKISVRDNGKGIGEAFQKAIFEKFYQADNQTLRKPKGSGLGLPISRRIVELHEGNLQVISTLNEGAYFYFTIPCILKNH
ncbi:MAG: sensor histidine kinase [Chitinophagales bacterium]